MRAYLATGLGVAALAGAIAWAQMPAGKLDAQQQIVQALNRLTWGIEPGDIEAVGKIGLKKWIDQQLHPDTIPENPELQAALAPLDSLRMSPAEMMAAYPPGQVIQQMALEKRPLPGDPKLRGIVEGEIEALRQRQAAKSEADAATAPGAAGPAAASRSRGDAEDPVEFGAPPLDQVISAEQAQQLETGSVRDRVAALEALPEPTRNQVVDSLPRKDARQLSPWLPLGQQREAAYYLTPQQVTSLDLLGAKILSAVYSNRQLEDVLTDFWFNHFNIYIQKGQDHELITSYERDAIRPHVLGKFKDLLTATAESPAMLFYLDNWQSVDPAIDKRGINENYGREIMELHTLGVNGGYTQKDVTEVARCFTGWTIREPLRQATFFYNDRLHDHGPKAVLGHEIAAGGGMSDGLKVIDILASSPATAHHISYELAQRFVADDPPPALVDRMAATFLTSDGDLRDVMETMIQSSEFWDPANYRNKVKSPLEMVVSAVRGLGADVSNPTRLEQLIGAMGEPLYAKEPPTGYLNTGDQWVSSSGLIARLNFAMQLAANQIPGVQVDLTPFATGEATLPIVEQNLFQTLLLGQVSPGTQSTVERVMATTPPAAGAAGGNPLPASPAQIQRIAGLVLGSPDFQKR